MGRYVIPAGTRAYLERRGVLELIVSIAETHRVTADNMLSPSRVRRFVRARDELFYRLVMERDFTLADAGEVLGRHHTTVLEGARRFATRLSGGEVNNNNISIRKEKDQ